MCYEKDILHVFVYDFELSQKSRRSRVYHQDEVLHIVKTQVLYIIIAKAFRYTPKGVIRYKGGNATFDDIHAYA